jgi:hypothetical protein
MNVLQKRAILDVSKRLDFKAVRQRQLVQLGRDRLGAERLNVACNYEIDIGAGAVVALGA